MSWTTLSVNPPVSNSVGSSADLSMFAITPWQHGEGSSTGARLSFPNAAALLAKKVDPQLPALAIAITASNFSDFASQCDLLITPFPLALLKQWKRRALQMHDLENSKLNLVQTQLGSQVTSINALPSIRDVQVADIKKKAFDDAVAFENNDPLADLDDLETEKAAFDLSITTVQADAASGLVGGSGWRFYATTDIANALQSNTPGNEYTLTGIVLFQGSIADLTLLTEIIQ